MQWPRSFIHCFRMTNEKRHKSDPIRTTLVITVGFIVVFIATQLKWAIVVSLCVGVFGLLSDRMASLIDFVWMKLARILSMVVPNIVLSAVFYLVLTPIAILSRIGRGNSLNLKNTEKSLFKKCIKDYDEKSFEHPW